MTAEGLYLRVITTCTMTIGNTLASDAGAAILPCRTVRLTVGPRQLRNGRALQQLRHSVRIPLSPGRTGYL